MSCGEVHSQARELVAQGYTATLVAMTLAISRSSLYYRKKTRGSRADRSYDEQIVMACGEKLAYGYRRVAWWLQRKKGLPVNRKRVLRVMRERGLLVRSRRLRARRWKEWGRVEASAPNQIWQSDMTKIWAGPAVGWAYLVSVIDCCTREIVGWNLSHRCRTEDALAAVEQAVLARLPEGSREANVTLTTDNGTQFTSSRFLETLGRLGITHRRTAYHHPEGNSYIERFHRSLKEEEVWTAEYRSLEEAQASIARWIEEYNHDRPHRGVRNRTPHNDRLQPVPSRLYSHKWMLDGFSAEQVDASGKPWALSWYFFIGPKSLREKDPSKAHIPTGTPQPVPGRIAQ
ncbi:MAG TPA: IS3 family transposase [Candidatus Sulfotelmatobacter sp.]|nr:IS3 family transposase [Candidatus Sulfotelmatobacter sp.]